MKPLVCALLACALSAGAVFACSPAELVQKQKAYGDAVKAAFARDPDGDGARQARVQAIIARYGALVKSTNGAYLIDMMCRENEELLAIYQQ